MTAPAIPDPAAADRWTWIILAACAQLRLARSLAADLAGPREFRAPGPADPRPVRRGFRRLRGKLPCPAGAPNPRSPARPPARLQKRAAAARNGVSSTARPLPRRRKQVKSQAQKTRRSRVFGAGSVRPPTHSDVGWPNACCHLGERSQGQERVVVGVVISEAAACDPRQLYAASRDKCGLKIMTKLVTPASGVDRLDYELNPAPGGEQRCRQTVSGTKLSTTGSGCQELGDRTRHRVRGGYAASLRSSGSR